MKTPPPFAVSLLASFCLLAPAAAPPHPSRTDAEGFALPPGAAARVGSVRFRHTHPMREVAWSADGKRIAAASYWGGIRIWEFPDGKLLRFVSRDDIEGWVRALTFRGSDLLALTQPGSGPPILATIPPEGKPVARPPLRTRIEIGADDRARIDLDGRQVVAFVRGKVHVFDLASGKPAAPRGGKVFRREATSPRGDRYATFEDRDEVQEITVCSMKDGAVLQRFSFPDRKLSPNRLDFTPNGRALVVRCDEQHTIALYDLSGRKWRWQVRTWPFQPGALAFSPDGKTFALLVGGDCPVFVETATGKLDPRTPDLFAGPRPVSFLNGGRDLLVRDSGLEVRTALTGRLVRKVPFVPREKRFVPWEWGAGPDRDDSYGWHWHHACSADARWSFAMADLKASRADGRTGEAGPPFELPVQKWCRVVCSSDGAHLIGQIFQAGVGFNVSVWDAVSGRPRHHLFVANDEKFRLIPGDDPRLLLTSVELWIRHKDTPPDPAVNLWDVVTGKRLGSFVPEGKPYHDCSPALSPDGSLVAAGSRLRRAPKAPDRALVQFWETASRRAWPQGAWDESDLLPSSLAFTAGGHVAAVGGTNGRLLLWEVASGKVRGEFRHRQAVHAVRFSPDGRLLAAASVDAPIYLWDTYGTHEVHPEEIGQAEGRTLWEELRSADAARAFHAVKRLVTSPKSAVTVIGEKCRSLLLPDREEVERLVAELDGDTLAVRDRATRRLLAMDEGADAWLHGARKRAGSGEVRRRLNRVLSRPIVLSAERLRLVRAVEVLGVVGTPEAAGVLKRLAAGPEDDRIVKAARSALVRIKGR